MTLGACGDERTAGSRSAEAAGEFLLDVEHPLQEIVVRAQARAYRIFNRGPDAIHVLGNRKILTTLTRGCSVDVEESTVQLQLTAARATARGTYTIVSP